MGVRLSAYFAARTPERDDAAALVVISMTSALVVTEPASSG